LTVALTLATVLSSLLRGVGLNVTGQSIDHVARPALTAMLIFAGYWTLGDISVRGALLYQIAATGLCAIAALAAFVAIAPRQTAGSTPYEPGNWKQVAMAFTLNASLVALNGNYPVILASLLVPASDVGVLRVALSAVGFLALPGSVANLATLPTVARQAAEGDERGLARTLSHTTLAAAGATAFGLLIIILIGRPLLSFLFGSEYQDAATPLIILGAGQLLIASFGTAGSYLNVTGRERLVVKAFGLAVPIGLLASVALGLAFGISGVAAGTIVMAAVWHFHIFVIHRNEVRVPLFVGSAARHVWGKS
jgi:O-antigen/teichoic acid export membrane protein